MTALFWALAALLLGLILGWASAHNTIANECKKLGRFYVGPDVYECTAIRNTNKGTP